MFLLSHMLKRVVRTGTLNIIDADGKMYGFGDNTPPVVTMRFHDPALAGRLFRNPELYVGEAYMDGTLTFDQGGVYDLLMLFQKNRTSVGSYPFQKALRKVWKLFRKIRQYNPAPKAQKNVAHHYDLSKELYKLFLDKDMQYSCAYFRSDDETIEQAQQNKKQHIAAKLHIKDGQRILDIGCGWGGMALYLAGLADVQVTGITLSKEQLEIAQQRAKDAGLEDRVKFVLKDYRHVCPETEGPFDRIVSVGMFEHVGVGHYDEFFAAMKNLLTDDGIALLHAIGHISPPGTTSPWIRKYIFPGGYAPAMSEVFASTERNYLWVADVEILRLHYAKTLRAWRERFEKNRAQIAKLYDERFCRMWEFYLISAEMVFSHGSSMVFQMQISRDRAALPLVRERTQAEEEMLKNAA